jgi:hypothetical protein
MKNIAIIGSLDCHLECISFLLEIFKEDSINIYINNTSDRYNFLSYYKTLYNFNVIYNNFNLNIINNNDLVIKLTSNDHCLDHENIISILHLNQPNQLICKSKKFLSLTPYIKGDNINYTFPLFSPVINDSYNNKIVTMVGCYTESNFDEDIINFININKHYTFNFIVWCSNNYSKLKTLENVNTYHGLDATNMMNIINNSKYILSKKYINYDRFSGQLGLALSYEKPLIIDIKSKNSYNLPGIVFNNNYSEIGNLDKINNECYDDIKTEIKRIKINILKNNSEILKSLF